jgi:predicted DNA-binding transcriptional regulator YafY
MNRTDRLLAIVLELQNKGRRRAEDLAATFETSKRTIYRDIQALSEAGVPLIAVPGLGYELVEGYFLPPLSFTADEAGMLLLGSEYVAQNFDTEYRRVAEAASRKIEGVLPEKLREEARSRQNSIRFISQAGFDPELLKTLRRAVIEHCTVEFIYQSRQKEQRPARREVEPYTLALVEGNWYLVALDRLKGDIRRFRLDRMSEFSFTGHTFTRPPDFKVEENAATQDRSLIVRLLFKPEAVRWVRESRYYYLETLEEQPEGLLVTLKVRHEREPLNWLLSWGSSVKVLEPELLKEIIAREAQAILEIYK